MKTSDNPHSTFIENAMYQIANGKKPLMPTLFFLLLFVLPVKAEEPAIATHENIPYYSDAVLAEADEYQKSQCRLDISAPKGAKRLPILVWFHGGGLTGGKKEIPRLLKDAPIVLVGVGYRLAPKAEFPNFLEDAAAAVDWTFANIEQYGGDPQKIFVGGNSAGGYLSGMIGLDPRWSKDRERIAGLVLLTGQMTTHFHVRKMLGYEQPEYLPIVDENAPMFHLSKDAPPILLLVGDRKVEWPARVEENELMAAALRAMKHPHIEFYEHGGYDHGKMGDCPAAFARIRHFVTKEELPYFSDDPEGGKKLDLLFRALDKESRSVDEIVDTVRGGLLTCQSHKMPVLRWIGNKYIWGKNPQDEKATELMVEASRLQDENIYHAAIYFGLSTVQKKTPEIFQAMIDVAMKTEDYRNTTWRIEWGCSAPTEKAELLRLLEPHLQSDDEKVRTKAENVRDFLNDPQAWLAVDLEKKRQKALEEYGPRFSELQKRLIEGDSKTRFEMFHEFYRNNVTLVLDDSFKEAFEACAKDTDMRVRRELARLVGGSMIWSAKKQSPMAVALLREMLRDSDRDVRYNAVYHGLSTVRNRSEEQVAELLELIRDDREPNLFQRVIWGLQDDKEKVKTVLEQWKAKETDSGKLKKIEEIYNAFFSI